MTFIIEINQDQFVDEVIEKSKTIPVIVDFLGSLVRAMQTADTKSRKNCK